MKAAPLLLLAAALAGCGSSTAPPAAPEPADLVVLGGDLRTMNAAQPQATAFAVKGGRIIAVGIDIGIQPLIGEKTRVIKAEGRTVLPGLIDSHIHAAEGALARDGCSLGNDELTIAQAAPRIKTCFENDKDSKWLMVIDVNPAGFKANRAQLDAIVKDRPLFLWGADGHTAWVNSRALELAKITRGTRDPADGRIERDASGEPTGFLVDGAVGLVLGVMEKPTMEKRLEKLRWILEQLQEVGITSYLEANTDADTVDSYVALSNAFDLNANVTIALESSGADTPAEFDRLIDLRNRTQKSPLLRTTFIKLFADGVLEHPTQTAALLTPYLDEKGKATSSTGKLYLEPSAMASFVRHADEKGFNIHVHAIGDAGVRETLDAFAAARAAGSKRLYSVSHLQLIDPADLPRFAQLDVMASFQLLWAQPDNYSIDAVQKFIGPERFERQYPTRDLLNAKGVIAGGSDWDVSSFNPFEAIATAMSRKNPEHPERPPLGANEALTLDEMLAAYTIHAARLIGWDDEVGSIAVGKSANFIVLPAHLTEKTPATEVYTMKPALVFFAGNEVAAN